MKLEPKKSEPTENQIVSTASTSKEPDENVLKKIQILCGVLVVALILFGVWFAKTWNTKQTTLADQKAKIASLQDTLTEYQETNKKQEAEDAEAAKGDRILRDNALASEFMEKLLSYSSYEDYMEIRNWLKDTHHVAETDRLLTSFFPELPKETVEATNMTFEGATSYTIKTDGDKRFYFALCRVSNRIDGNSGSGHVGLFYTIDEDGTFQNLAAYTLVR